MRIIICDDDNLFSAQLQKCITEFFQRSKIKIPDIAVYENGESVLSDNGEKDIVFLDIEMPGLSGIYVGNELKKKNENIIIFIITSFVEYLDEAMRFHVFRYLSKPLDRMRLFRNLKDAIQAYHSSVAKLLVETKEGCHTILATDIISIEALGRDITVHTLQGDYKSVYPMKYWADTLTMNCFFQTHRSFIINMKHVSGFDHSLIHLCDEQYEAYLTRRKYTEFKQAYLLYLESAR